VETSEDDIKAKKDNKEYIRTILYVTQDTHYLCGTCKNAMKSGRVPTLALANGFNLPEIPEVLKVCFVIFVY